MDVCFAKHPQFPKEFEAADPQTTLREYCFKMNTKASHQLNPVNVCSSV